MHTEAFEFVEQFRTDKPIHVIEIGSRNINGSVRPLFPNATWVGLDLHPGPDVDLVLDAREYNPLKKADLVICCEVLEHTPHWRAIVDAGRSWLKPDGKMVVTCAGPGREPHSAIDGGPLQPDEYYANIRPDMLDVYGAQSVSFVGTDTRAVFLRT